MDPCKTLTTLNLVVGAGLEGLAAELAVTKARAVCAGPRALRLCGRTDLRRSLGSWPTRRRLGRGVDPPVAAHTSGNSSHDTEVRPRSIATMTARAQQPRRRPRPMTFYGMFPAFNGVASHDGMRSSSLSRF
jgi:hypothetical protein